MDIRDRIQRFEADCIDREDPLAAARLRSLLWDVVVDAMRWARDPRNTTIYEYEEEVIAEYLRRAGLTETGE